MSKLGTIVTVTDPYTERKCAALVIGEQEDGTLDLRVFRHDQSDIELISVAFSENEPEHAASSDDQAATDAEPAAPVQDGTSHSDQREQAAPVPPAVYQQPIPTNTASATPPPPAPSVVATPLQ